MSETLITLTTDFGEDSPYVAALKGAVLSVNPQARLLDLSHQIPAQDLRHTAFFLAAAIPYFPPGVIHVVVVDPGVGTERAILHVELDGHRLLVPDNGCWTLLAARLDVTPHVRRLSNPRYWRSSISATFHGRDIFAPAAAHLSLGVPAAELGPTVADWTTLGTRPAILAPDHLAGEIVFVDHFGNLITNVPGEAFAALEDRTVVVEVGDYHAVPERRVEYRVDSYGEVEPGTVIALVSSSGFLEIAVNQGSAAQRLGVAVGTPVLVRW